MGACYSVTLNIKGVKDEEKMKSAMQHVIAERNGNGARYSLEEHLKEGVGTDTIDDLFKIFLAGWKVNSFQKDEIGNGEIIYTNDFNASYGWCDEIDEMFKAIAPYVEDGTSLAMDVENDYYLDVVEGGKVVPMENETSVFNEETKVSDWVDNMEEDNEWEKTLIDVVKKFGKCGGIQGEQTRLDIDTKECTISWTYWDDNDDEQNDDDGEIKVLYALVVNGEGRLICKWDGNFAEAYNSLDEDLQLYIHDEIVDLVMSWENQSEYNN